MPRVIPTHPGRWYGRWNRYPWRWFDVYELETSHGTFLVTDQLDSEEGGTWYVNHGAFEWREEVMNLTNEQIEELRAFYADDRGPSVVAALDELLRLRKVLGECYPHLFGSPTINVMLQLAPAVYRLRIEARRCRGLDEPSNTKGQDHARPDEQTD